MGEWYSKYFCAKNPPRFKNQLMFDSMELNFYIWKDLFNISFLLFLLQFYPALCRALKVASILYFPYCSVHEHNVELILEL